ncbi:MAG: hypothetical protein IJ593_03020 [Lachnospiraceae bacterium]|nr:hypothetical protein [Lachnospiraceae bacterium]
MIKKLGDIIALIRKNGLIINYVKIANSIKQMGGIYDEKDNQFNFSNNGIDWMWCV